MDLCKISITVTTDNALVISKIAKFEIDPLEALHKLASIKFRLITADNAKQGPGPCNSRGPRCFARIAAVSWH